jgi:hypothetical protein
MPPPGPDCAKRGKWDGNFDRLEGGWFRSSSDAATPEIAGNLLSVRGTLLMRAEVEGALSRVTNRWLFTRRVKNTLTCEA